MDSPASSRRCSRSTGDLARVAGAMTAVAIVFLGTAGCAISINDALAEARHGNKQSVEDAIVKMGEILETKERADIPFDEGDLAALDYLREAASEKSPPLNRARAISALGKLKRADANDLYRTAVQDPFWLLRLEAAAAIARHPEPADLDPVIEQLRKESRVEVRIELVQALDALGGERALKVLLDVLLDRTGRYRRVRLSTYDAVVRLSGKSYDLEDAESWRKLYDERFPHKSSIENEEAPDAAATGS